MNLPVSREQLEEKPATSLHFQQPLQANSAPPRTKGSRGLHANSLRKQMWLL